METTRQYFHLRLLLICCLCLCSFLAGGQHRMAKALQAEKRQYADSLYKAAIASNDTLQLAEAYFMFGKLAYPTNDLEAYKWFQKSLQLLEPRGPSFELGRLYIYKASITYGKGLIEESKIYNRKAKKIFIEAKSERGMKQFKSLFETPKEQEKKRKATSVDTILTSEEVEILFSNTRKQLLGRITDTTRRDFYKALNYYAAHRSQHPFMYAITLLSMAQMEIKENKLAAANDILKNLRKIIHEEFDYHTKLKLYLATTEHDYQVAKKDWKAAHIALLQLRKIEKETFEADRNAAISKIQIEFETTKKEQLLVSKEKELTSNQNLVSAQKLVIYSIGTFMLILIVAFANIYKLYKENKKINRKNTLLLIEQNHRVKNNLQFVSSMLNVQKNMLNEPETIVRIGEIQMRIESMSILQRKLYSDERYDKGDAAEYLEEVINNVLTSCGYDEAGVSIQAERIMISPKILMPLGIIITELVFNSCKYAFKKSESAEIMLNIVQSEKTLRMVYQDSGTGIPDAISIKNNGGGFGLEMIDMQIEQLHGKLEVSNNLVVIEFPLS